MSTLVRCGKRMDGSGPGADFSSPNYMVAELVRPVSLPTVAKDERLPLPSGHPVSWGLLTRGTLLEGSAYADCT
jgi:hypothetical protein